MSEDGSSPSAHQLDEFSLINRFFVDSRQYQNVWSSQGIGDDCAFLDIGDQRIAVTVDMMSMGSHFLEDADPYTVGRKALAVNLSDLAAAGATPNAFFLSLSLPEIDQNWLQRFSDGLKYESALYNCPIRGGDTTRMPQTDGKPGKTTISITALGALPQGKGLTRRGAKVGDDVWVSGTPGDAYAALATVWKLIKTQSEDFAYFKQRMDTPTPRVALGQALLDVAHACCDISDGLVGDLKHILDLSGVSATLYWGWFPKSVAMTHLTDKEQQRCVLAGGDDYELLFTASPEVRQTIEEIGRQLNVTVTRIGQIQQKQCPYKILDQNGNELVPHASFNHFA